MILDFCAFSTTASKNKLKYDDDDAGAFEKILKMMMMTFL